MKFVLIKDDNAKEFSADDLVYGVVINKYLNERAYGIKRKTLEFEDLYYTPHEIDIDTDGLQALIRSSVFEDYLAFVITDDYITLEDVKKYDAKKLIEGKVDIVNFNCTMDMCESDRFVIFSKSGELLYCDWDRKAGEYEEWDYK